MSDQPNWRLEIRRRLDVRLPAGREREIVEEIAQDLEQRFEDLRAGGVSEDEARRLVLRALDDGAQLSRNLTRVEPPQADSLTGSPARNPWPGLWQDVRLAARVLGRDPVFAVVSIATLAFGIGANLAMFSVAYTALWQPLPFRAPASLIHVQERRPNGALSMYTSLPNYLDWRAGNQSFEAIAAYTDTSATLTGAGDPRRIDAIQFSASMLPLLGIEPMIGRNFLEDENRQHGPPAVLLSAPLWAERFGADPAIVGRTLTLDGRPHTIVGVMPREFQFPIRSEPIDLFLPIGRDPFPQMQLRDGRLVLVVARLRPGVTIDQAAAEMTTIASRLAQTYPATNKGWDASVVPLHEDWFGSARQALLLLMGAVGFVLLIGCGNLASLLLARATNRQRDVAVRQALGASRVRLVQQQIVQSLVVAIAGGVVGLLVGVWLRSLVVTLAPASLPRLATAALDAPTLLAAFGATIAAGLLIGAGPAWLTSRAATLASERGAAGGARHNRFFQILLVGEIAVSLVLLAGAGLFARSLQRLMAVSPGFDATNVLAVPLELPTDAYPDGRRAEFFTEVLDRVAQLPGVESAAVAFPLPFGGPVAFPFTIEGAPAPGRRLTAYYRAVSPRYFETLRIPLERGRVFTSDDRASAPAVMVINRAMADQLFPGEQAIGKRLRVVDRNAGDRATSREIVGIVGNVRHLGLDRPSGPEMYVPHQQAPSQWMSLVVRAAGGAQILPAVTREIHGIDPGLPVQGAQPLGDRIARSAEQRRFNARLLGAFAVSALLLALVGISGTTAYVVARRTPEIAVRISVGATFGDVMRLVLGGTLRVALVGVALGLVASVVLARTVQGMLFETSAVDPLTLLAAGAAMTALTLVAGFGPARRAATIDPLVALRRD